MSHSFFRYFRYISPVPPGGYWFIGPDKKELGGGDRDRDTTVSPYIVQQQPNLKSYLYPSSTWYPSRVLEK